MLSKEWGHHIFYQKLCDNNRMTGGRTNTVHLLVILNSTPSTLNYVGKS